MGRAVTSSTVKEPVRPGPHPQTNATTSALAPTIAAGFRVRLRILIRYAVLLRTQPARARAGAMQVARNHGTLSQIRGRRDATDFMRPPHGHSSPSTSNTRGRRVARSIRIRMPNRSERRRTAASIESMYTAYLSSFGGSSRAPSARMTRTEGSPVTVATIAV